MTVCISEAFRIGAKIGSVNFAGTPMNLIRTIATALIATLLTSACASKFHKDSPDDFDAPLDPNYGIVVGSVSSIGDGNWQEMSQYNYRSLTNDEIKGVYTSAAEFSPFSIFVHVPNCKDDGLEPECGRLFATALPAGEYEFYAVEICLTNVTEGSEGRRLLGYNFTVVAGQVIYLGNFKSAIEIGALSRYGNGVIAANGVVSDQFERDVPLLKKKFPGLAARDIVPGLLLGEPWEWRRANKGKDDVTFH